MILLGPENVEAGLTSVTTGLRQRPVPFQRSLAASAIRRRSSS